MFKIFGVDFFVLFIIKIKQKIVFDMKSNKKNTSFYIIF
jgi:hypothetical protein